MKRKSEREKSERLEGAAFVWLQQPSAANFAFPASPFPLSSNLFNDNRRSAAAAVADGCQAAFGVLFL